VISCPVAIRSGLCIKHCEQTSTFVAEESPSLTIQRLAAQICFRVKRLASFRAIVATIAWLNPERSASQAQERKQLQTRRIAK
jgi:hypothetical protein